MNKSIENPMTLSLLRAVYIFGFCLIMGACSPPAGSDLPIEEASEQRQLMTSERLGELIIQIDPDAQLTSNSWRFTAGEQVVAVIYDVEADRMRIMIPIAKVDELEEEQTTRMLQANFDSALDARYAIARGTVWSTFIHPLSPLTDEEFLMGVGQTLSAAKTFGDTYSSGLFQFGAGDSAEIEHQRLIELLRKRIT